MLQNPPELSETQRSSAAELARRRAGDVAVAAVVGAAFYLVAKIVSWGTAFQPDGVSLFWPPTGLSCGLLIVLGPQRRWPAVAGIVAASAAINYASWHNLWVTPAIAACNAMEALIVAGLFTRYFGGADFPLDRARNIFGLLGATAVAAFASSLIATAVLRLSLGPSIVVVFTLQHWFASVFVGIVAVTPLVIGLADAVRHPPSRREYVEGTFALLSLALVTLIIVALPRQSWEVLLPVAWPFPILVWLAARSRPVFAAAGGFLVSNIIVWTTNFGVGHFGDTGSSLGNRVLEAQAAILFLAVSAYLLAALFAERRESESRLARSNALLQRERDNKLMSLRAAVASISHEVAQPLTAISANAGAARQFLDFASPDIEQAKSALRDLIDDSSRTTQILDNVRQLFGSEEREKEQIDMNDVARTVLRLLRGELIDYGVTTNVELATDLPLVKGHRVQLQEVVLNLANNAVDALSAVNGNRSLKIRSRHDVETVIVEVEDSGPGIESGRLHQIFEAFITTKAKGMGLGLAICHTIVEQHGGKLTALSDGRSGALFRVSLPIEGMIK